MCSSLSLNEKNIIGKNVIKRVRENYADDDDADDERHPSRGLKEVFVGTELRRGLFRHIHKF